MDFFFSFKKIFKNLSFKSLFTGWSLWNLSCLWVVCCHKDRDFEKYVKMYHEASNQNVCTKASRTLLIDLIREKAFKQRIPIILKNTETYLHLLDYPNSEQIHLLYFHPAHVNFQTHAKDLLRHSKFAESHKTHWVRTAFALMALYKVVPWIW